MEQATGSSILKITSTEVSMMTSKPKIFSFFSGFWGFLLTPILASISEGSVGHLSACQRTGRPEEEGVGASVIPCDYLGEHASFEYDIEAGLVQFFFEVEDLIQDAGLLWMSLFKGKAQNLRLRPWRLLWEVGRRAVYPDTDLFSQDDFLWVGESVEGPSSDGFDDALKLDTLTRRREIPAPLVPGIGGKQGAVGGNDRIGEKPQEFCDLYEHMEDPVI